MGGFVLAGMLVVIVLMIPSLQGEVLRIIPIAAGVGDVLGIPLAMIAVRSITRKTS
ncbi:hypothetical protein GJ654_08325 [Rhodoblastus acidophilus]|uniref:Uncharacterized protein n=1 Tax=Rhodoblastus acidophilus TaxID=1074 RepID=A0A6N8DKM7_RHOAC|nr:hypothetical protein [Rhodoblastus acidophilus]MCW2273855.1 hypothetical protein [Rhodoblastus acidophilus]MTV30999.1 hypothetical protein [Rhodoblastus acidophilus]